MSSSTFSDGYLSEGALSDDYAYPTLEVLRYNVFFLLEPIAELTDGRLELFRKDWALVAHSSTP